MNVSAVALCAALAAKLRPTYVRLGIITESS
jgi:hypothetical protein